MDEPNYGPNHLITDYPYMGWNNVWGGGGADQGADIAVPPQKNLYYGTGFAGISAMSLVIFAMGMVAGYFVVPKVKKKFFPKK